MGDEGFTRQCVCKVTAAVSADRGVPCCTFYLRHPEGNKVLLMSTEACSVCLDALRASLLAVQPDAGPPAEAAEVDFVAMANSIGGAMISLSYLVTDSFLYLKCVWFDRCCC